MSPAWALWADTDLPVEDFSVLDLPFVLPGISLADDLSDELMDSGIIGGVVSVAIGGDPAQLAVEACYWAPASTSEALKKRLILETVRQWSDGAGEGGFVAKTAQGEALIFASARPEDATLLEDDDGRSVPSPSRVARLARDGRLDELRAALQEGEQFDGIRGGYSALQLAILFGRSSSARLLVESGADVNRRDCLGYSPLELVALSNDLGDQESAALAGAMLSRGAMIDDIGLRLRELAVGRGKSRLESVIAAGARSAGNLDREDPARGKSQDPARGKS